MLETIATGLGILVVLFGLVRWWWTRQTHVGEKWVDLSYFEKSGLKERLESAGFKYTWATARKQRERVEVDGWEVVVEKDNDGKRVCFKCKDHDAVGGFIILLKKRLEKLN